MSVIASYPHEEWSFTQGLEWVDGELYESTGTYGRSEIRRVNLATGQVLERRALDRELFGEGLAAVDDRLIQLTWREGVAIVWDRESLTETGRFAYEGEGWGLCFDGERLVMSDGSDRLVFRDPEDFSVIGSVQVEAEGASVDNLNELECVGDRVLANVYKTDEIVEIDPSSGEVTSTIDASSLERGNDADVLNGIVHIPDGDRLFLTGKNWLSVYEVTLVDAP